LRCGGTFGARKSTVAAPGLLRCLQAIVSRWPQGALITINIAPDRGNVIALAAGAGIPRAGHAFVSTAGARRR
jgi:hypothetical protein